MEQAKQYLLWTIPVLAIGLVCYTINGWFSSPDPIAVYTSRGFLAILCSLGALLAISLLAWACDKIVEYFKFREWY